MLIRKTSAAVLATIGLLPIALYFLVGYAPVGRMIDHAVYWTAGQSVLHGRPVYGTATPGEGLWFTYPPFAALVMVPLAVFPLGVSQWLWLVAGIFVPLAVTVRYAFQVRTGPAGGAVLLVACACLGPVLDLVRFGQIGMLLAALCVVDCLAPRTRWPRGMLIGLATSIKLVPGLFIVYLWLTGRRQAALVAAATTAAAMALSFLLIPRDFLDYWLGGTTDTYGHEAARFANLSLLGITEKLHLPVAAAVVAGLGVGCLGLWAARWVSRGGYEVGAVAIVGLLGVLLSPYSWTHHLVWAVVAVAAVLGDGRRRGDRVVAAIVFLAFLWRQYAYAPALAPLGIPGSAARALGILWYDFCTVAALVLLTLWPVREHLFRMAPKVWAAVTAVCALSPIAFYFFRRYPELERMSDFAVYWTAGRSVLHDLPLYETFSPKYALPFIYPPFGALVMVPFGVFPLTVSQWLWLVAGIFVPLAVTVAYAFRGPLTRMGRWAPLGGAAIVAGCAYLGPVLDVVWYGQIGMLLAALCVVDCLAPRTRWPRGMLIGLATSIKLVPGLFIVYLWITGRRRAALVAGGTAAVTTVVAFVLLPRDSLAYWLGQTADTYGTQSARYVNVSLLGALRHLHLSGSATTALWLVVVAAVGWFGMRAAQRAARDGAQVAAVAIVGLLSVLVCPLSWTHHLVWAVVAIAAVLGDGTRPVRRAAAAGIWLAFLWRQAGYAPLLEFAGFAKTTALNLGILWYDLCALAILGVLVRRRARRPAVADGTAKSLSVPA